MFASLTPFSLSLLTGGSKIIAYENFTRHLDQGPPTPPPAHAKRLTEGGFCLQTTRNDDILEMKVDRTWLVGWLVGPPNSISSSSSFPSFPFLPPPPVQGPIFSLSSYFLPQTAAFRSDQFPSLLSPLHSMDWEVSHIRTRFRRNSNLSPSE